MNKIFNKIINKNITVQFFLNKKIYLDDLPFIDLSQLNIGISIKKQWRLYLLIKNTYEKISKIIMAVTLNK